MEPPPFEAQFSRPNRIYYPETTSTEVVMQAQREIARANFNAKPENYAIQLEIKQRNDRTKVELFK